MIIENSLFSLNLFSDKIWFPIFEFFLAGITLFVFLKVKVFQEQSPVSGVLRGKTSRELFLKVAGAIMIFIITVIFSITTFPEDGLVLLYILNLVCVLYLCLVNGWSTNKLIGLMIKFENHNFNPHRQ